MFALCLAITTLAPSLPRADDVADRVIARTEAFATCAGRFSALATRQRADHNPRSSRAARFEDEFDALVDAILPLALNAGLDHRRARYWRNAGWIEMAHLMRHHFSSNDRGRADRAGREIERRLATCTRMVLPG